MNEGQSVEITAVDREILELKLAVDNLHSQTDHIQRKIDQLVPSSLCGFILRLKINSISCTQKISSALQQKRQSTALSYLRSKKQLEKLLTRRLGSLEILQSILIQVEGAAGDVAVGHQLFVYNILLTICLYIDNEILRVLNHNPSNNPSTSVTAA
jgi:charged multivesicular body protein 7